MAAHVIDGLLDLHPGLTVDEVILGCANQAGEDNRNVARMAVLLSRLPETVPALTVNRLCAWPRCGDRRRTRNPRRGGCDPRRRRRKHDPRALRAGQGGTGLLA
jgi:hypothetical protein